MLILALVAAAAPSTCMTALLGLIPMILGAIALVIFDPETKRKQLERITAEELDIKEPSPPRPQICRT